MAGKRQHYIPRLLQRGFLADVPGGAERTWLHRHGLPARLVSIRDVGTRDWFYSQRDTPGEPTLDDAITAFEGDLSKDVARLRQKAGGTRINSKDAARTLVHLVTRTAHLRQILEDGVDRFIGEAGPQFTDPVQLAEMMGINSPTLDPIFLDAIRKEIHDRVPVGIPASLIERLLTFFARERSEEIMLQATETLALTFRYLSSSLANSVRDAHNTIIARPLDDHGWVDALATFHWSIDSASELILPDAVALASVGTVSLTPLLFTTANEATLVLMPIAKDRMLVGRRNQAQSFDLTTYNVQAAACCQDFFIAAHPLDGENLNIKIGSRLSRALNEMISDALNESNIEQSGEFEANQKLNQPLISTGQAFSFPVIVHDFGDKYLVNDYIATIQPIIQCLSRDMPLHLLDGITIAINYADALAQLNRLDPGLAPATSNSLVYDHGVAKTVTVIRNGKTKLHLVIAAEIANSWVSSDPELRASGIHALARMLAAIGYKTRYAEVPEMTPDTIGRELHMAVAHVPCAYWTAKQAAFVASDQGAAYADLVISSLEFTQTSLAEARARMSDDTDVEEAFQIALECVSSILTHVADWAGHRDGLADGQPFAGDDLAKRLTPFGLDHWLTLFASDLATAHAHHYTINQTVIQMLSRHVERLFWALGIYCWPEGETIRCIVSELPLIPAR